MGGRSHCNCPRLNNSLWWHSKLNIKKICTKHTHIFLHWGNQQQHNLPLIIFLSVFDLIFVFDSCNGYFHPWKSLNFSIQQKVLCDALMMDYHEIYTKKACKKINCFVYILTDFGIGSLVIIIYIGHYFLPIAYVIFTLTQRLVPVTCDRKLVN